AKPYSFTYLARHGLLLLRREGEGETKRHHHLKLSVLLSEVHRFMLHLCVKGARVGVFIKA
ncbi:MAG: hypothetical protein M3298_03760, partial [Thermoproteota archaeon]|nr:hypothetical protein [Thermoproteota archaeon]